MKSLLAVLFVSLPAIAAAGDTQSAFSGMRIDAPPLSLLENSLQGAPRYVSDFGRECKAAVERPVIASRMPIVSPKAGLDPTMVKAPDLSIDCKLIVKFPDIEPFR